MGRMKNWLLGLLVAASAVSGACASMGSRSISEVQTNPGKFHDKTVTVEGVVTTSFGIPMVPFKVFRVSDGVHINLLLVQEGYAEARPFEPNTTRQAELDHAEDQAKAAHRGLWPACGSTDVPIGPPPGR